MIEYIPIPIDDMKLLQVGDYIKYKKKGDDEPDKIIYGFVKGHWVVDNTSGLILSHSRSKQAKQAKTWTISYVSVKDVYKKINPYILFEFNYMLKSVK